jgi:hypothetical protein
MNAKHTAVMSESTIVGGTNSQSQPIESNCLGPIAAMMGLTKHDRNAQSQNPVKCGDMATAAKQIMDGAFCSLSNFIFELCARQRLLTSGIYF